MFFSNKKNINKLFYWIDEIRKENDGLRKENVNLRESLKNLEHRVYDLEFVQKLYNECTVLGIATNKVEETFHVCALKKNDSDWMMILLKRPDYPYLAPPRINLETTYAYESKNWNERILKIVDIIPDDNNIGNGSIMMNYLLKDVKQHPEIKRIVGTISSVDKDHYDRLEHFYKKFGFSVEFYTDNNGEKTGGSIEKVL
jgi:hypothetical protein